MKLLILASALAFLAPVSSAQTQTFYQTFGTGDQVLPGPGAAAPRSMTVQFSVTADTTGIQIFAAGFAGGVPDVTDISIYGPATATTTGPALYQLQFTQQAGSDFAAINTFDEILPTAVRDLIEAGETYLEVRTTAFPNGALRGAIHTYNTVCKAAFDANDPCGQCPCGNGPALQTQGGCLNSEGRSAELTAVGVPAVSDDSLSFPLRQASSNAFALLLSGSNLLSPAGGTCPIGSGVTGSLTDGLRCVGSGVLRHGTLATDGTGATAFGAASPQGGLIGPNSFMAGQTRAFQ
ncbi:MAG: CHRD domain-containing protein, partial [Planctomycetota bacterium]